MRGIIATLLLAAAAVLFVSAEASASWTCKAYGPTGNYGWGTDDNKGAASQRALSECSKYGGGCRITGCQGSNPVVRPTCPPGQQMGENGRCREAYKTCSNGERIPVSRNCPAVVQYKRCPNGEQVPVTSTCPCPPGQQRNDAGRCYEVVKRCPNGEQIPVSRHCPPVVEYKRCPNGERIPVSNTCPCPPGHRMGDNGRCYEVVQRCPDGSRMPDSGRCPKKEAERCWDGSRIPSSGDCPCREGQVRNSAGDCYTPTTHTPPPPPPPREAAIRCDLGAAEGYPPAGDLPRSIYEIKVGNTSLFAGGYADIAANRNDCKGVTANGCYLRVTNVPKLNGGTAPACVQFCKEQLCPPTQASPPRIANIPEERPPPPRPTGKPASLTLAAPPYVAPQPRGKRAVPTLIAAPYVAPKPRGKPAVPTVTAAPYVVPAAKR